MRIAPMMRTIDIILLAVLIGVVSWTFQVKHESQEALERVSELEKQIAAERIEIDLLKSDWSLLTSPARLQKLVERYAEQLGLEPMAASQMSNESELPAIRQPNLPDSDGGNDEDFAGVDNLSNTGSIKVAIPQPRGSQQ